MAGLEIFVVTFYRTVTKTSLKNLEDPLSEYDVGQTQQRSPHSLCFQVLEMQEVCFFGFRSLRLFSFPSGPFLFSFSRVVLTDAHLQKYLSKAESYI